MGCQVCGTKRIVEGGRGRFPRHTPWHPLPAPRAARASPVGVDVVECLHFLHFNFPALICLCSRACSHPWACPLNKAGLWGQPPPAIPATGPRGWVCTASVLPLRLCSSPERPHSPISVYPNAAEAHVPLAPILGVLRGRPQSDSFSSSVDQNTGLVPALKKLARSPAGRRLRSSMARGNGKGSSRWHRAPRRARHCNQTLLRGRELCSV